MRLHPISLRPMTPWRAFWYDLWMLTVGPRFNRWIVRVLEYGEIEPGQFDGRMYVDMPRLVWPYLWEE